MILCRDNCYWCNRPTFSSQKVGPTHAQCATVDHVRSKPECLSGKEYRHPDNKVNACYECNQRRSAEWVKRNVAGLVHPTPWSIRQCGKEARRRQRKKARAERREFLKNCQPCPVIKIIIPAELEEAFRAQG